MISDDWMPTFPGFGPHDSGAAGAHTQRELFALSDALKADLASSASDPVPTRPNLVSSKPPPPTTTHIRGSPTATIVPVTITRLPPLDTLPVLHDMKTPGRKPNLKRDIQEAAEDLCLAPPSKYETPQTRQAMVFPPGSAFLPKYTPAAGPVDLFLESLAVLPTSPLPEDQYEVTDFEESDSGEPNEDEVQERRAQKRIPAWCANWIETAKTQTSIDPETVFGTQLPKCDLEVLFGALAKDSAYLRARKGKRGSSGEWGLDRITKTELDEYRQAMGHTQQLESVVIRNMAEEVN